jgi:hypothetical protein
MIDLDDFLEDQLSTLARHWETNAPPIGLDEAIARAERGGIATLVDPDDADFDDRYDHDEPLVVVSAITHEPNRRWKPMLMLGAAAALVIVGLVVLANRDSNDREPFRPGIDTVAPQPTAQVTVTTSATTTAGSSPAPPTAVSTTSSTTPPSVPTIAELDPTTETLSTIQSSVAASLATFDTFRATATMQLSTAEGGGDPVDGPVTINNVTMTANGSLWSEGSPITWQSYDAMTGIARTATDSMNVYMQWNGWYTIPLDVILGVNPVPRLDDLGSNVVVDETEQDGRPVWEINSTHDLTQADGAPEHRDETFEIDKESGLVIGYTKITTRSGTTTVQTGTLTNLEFNVDFPPPEFPGTFPPDAQVQSSGDESAFQLITIDEAGARFGDGFVVTPALPPTARITFESGIFPTVGTDGVMIVGTNQRLKVTMDFPTGFAPTSITISKDVDAGGASSGDGSVCRTIDGKTCLGADGASVVTAGALKGVPSDLRLGLLTIHNGVITVTIRAPSDQQALALANSLVTVD